MHSTFFGEKHDFNPYEDVTPIEKLCQKYDQALFSFCSHNKKRPNNVMLGTRIAFLFLNNFLNYIDLGRLYDHHLLDMFEFGLEEYKPLSEFKTAKVSTGVKPCLIFSGDVWNQNDEYIRCKNFLTDYFRGEVAEQVRLIGFEHALSFTAADGKIFMRSYK